jgi:hypothetical protein
MKQRRAIIPPGKAEKPPEINPGPAVEPIRGGIDYTFKGHAVGIRFVSISSTFDLYIDGRLRKNLDSLRSFKKIAREIINGDISFAEQVRRGKVDQ